MLLVLIMTTMTAKLVTELSADHMGDLIVTVQHDPTEICEMTTTSYHTRCLASSWQVGSRVIAMWLLGLGYYTYSLIKAEVDRPQGITCFLKVDCCSKDACPWWPLNAVAFFDCLSHLTCLDSLISMSRPHLKQTLQKHALIIFF